MKMKKHVFVTALSALVILVGGVFTAVAANGQQPDTVKTVRITDQPGASTPAVSEVVMTRPATATAATTTAESTTTPKETTASTTVAAVATTTVEATVETTAETEATTTTTTEPAKSQAQLLAESILDQMSEHLDAEYHAPAVWNAWERQLLFVGTYNGIRLDCTNDSATYNWDLISNPNNWQISICTNLTDDYGSVGREFVMPSEVDDYSQFMRATPSKLDQNNLGDYAIMTNGDTSIKFILNGDTLTIATQIGEDKGFVSEKRPLPDGFIVVCHTVYEESEIFDESISSAAAVYRTFGAFDQRYIDIVDAIAHLDIVAEQ